MNGLTNITKGIADRLITGSVTPESPAIRHAEESGTSRRTTVAAARSAIDEQIAKGTSIRYFVHEYDGHLYVTVAYGGEDHGITWNIEVP